MMNEILAVCIIQRPFFPLNFPFSQFVGFLKRSNAEFVTPQTLQQVEMSISTKNLNQQAAPAVPVAAVAVHPRRIILLRWNG